MNTLPESLAKMQGVIAVGDLYSFIPNPDSRAGGSLLGWGPVLEQVLKLDFDVVVPGRGPVVSRANLQALKNWVEGLVSRATSLVNEGVSESQLLNRLTTENPKWKIDLDKDQLDRFYAELIRR